MTKVLIQYLLFQMTRLSHSLTRGKTGVIEIQGGGAASSITRAKSGNLLVVTLILVKCLNYILKFCFVLFFRLLDNK